jgi:hypothetical protein
LGHQQARSARYSFYPYWYSIPKECDGDERFVAPRMWACCEFADWPEFGRGTLGEADRTSGIQA